VKTLRLPTEHSRSCRHLKEHVHVVVNRIGGDGVVSPMAKVHEATPPAAAPLPMTLWSSWLHWVGQAATYGQLNGRAPTDFRQPDLAHQAATASVPALRNALDDDSHDGRAAARAQATASSISETCPSKGSSWFSSAGPSSESKR
jgi:hypothetical protein